jgi:hypothetical protein
MESQNRPKADGLKDNRDVYSVIGVAKRVLRDL